MKTLGNKKIAIIGAGFCGLACAYHLSKCPPKGLDLQIDIFDPLEFGQNASGISAGLLHPYAGAHAKLLKRATEGLTATLELAKVSESALGCAVISKTGLLRVAISEEQKQDYYDCAMTHSDVRWCEPEECQKLVPGTVAEPGIFIENAYCMKTREYLEGLWKASNQQGVRWKKQHVFNLNDLNDYDYVIVAGGASINRFAEFKHLRVRPVKGQILIVEWPKNLPPLNFPINSKAYLVRSEDPSKCIVGATFERKFKNELPDMDSALEYLKPKMEEVFPELGKADILDCLSGVRASTPDHQPYIGRHDQKTWVITGMGSKGLLYHALYAKELVENLMHVVVSS